MFYYISGEKIFISKCFTKPFIQIIVFRLNKLNDTLISNITLPVTLEKFGMVISGGFQENGIFSKYQNIFFRKNFL